MSTVDELAERYSKSNGFRGAFRKGYAAGVEGVPSHKNPYRDKRTYRGGITYSRAFMRAWYDGWCAATGRDPLAEALA
jgi:hypothetical protein